MFAVLYGVVAYVLFLGTTTYLIGFTGNLGVPKSIDGGTAGPMAEAVIVDLLLLGAFAVQHSVMARRSFKRWWTRIVPHAIERSTYVLIASLVLLLLYWQWRPIPAPVWTVTDATFATVLNLMFWAGWATVFTSSFLINHFELFGLSQVLARESGRASPAPELKTPGFYRYVRHPLYLGFLLAFWAAPAMTGGHLLFAVAMTGYILGGIWFEERDLIAQFGERYRQYREQAGMLLPKPSRASLDEAPGPDRSPT